MMMGVFVMHSKMQMSLVRNFLGKNPTMLKEGVAEVECDSHVTLIV